MISRAPWIVVIGWLAAGCPVPPGSGTDTDGGSTGSSTTSAASMTSVASDTTASADGSSTGSTSVASASSDSTTGEPPSFDCPPAAGEWQCDVWDQDCPVGYKCVLWDAEGDALDPDATVCVPVLDDPEPLYGNCVEGITSCSDDCPATASCIAAYGEDGVCLDSCSEDGVCPGAQVCMTCGSCWNAWCVPTCDPLAPDCPETVGDCWLSSTFGQVAFSCSGLYGRLGAGESCDVGLCGSGLTCTIQEALGPDCADGYCCTELCSLIDPGFACSNPAHVCVPVFVPGQALPSQEHVGMCALPEAHPCNTPGLCPPPDIDPTYPWCSLDNENFCPRGNFGFGDAGACTQGCLCIDNCAVDADCPVPSTGNAVPVCQDFGPGNENDRCVLPCGGGQTCPDGMTCAPEWGDICMWISPMPPDEC